MGKSMLASFLLGLSLVPISRAQDQCENAGLGPLPQFDASNIYELPAFYTNDTRSSTNESAFNARAPFTIEVDPNRKWKLAYRIGDQSKDSKLNARSTERVGMSLMIDVGDSKVDDMGVCHHVRHPYDSFSSFILPKEVMQRSINDTGDCMEMFGATCVAALGDLHKEWAAGTWMRNGNCERIQDFQVPEECNDVLSLGPVYDMEMYRDWSHIFTTQSSSSTSNCTNSLARNTTKVLQIPSTMDYEHAVRFPLVDVMTFWPRRILEKGVDNSTWRDDVRVEVRCLKAENVARGSPQVRSAQSMIDDEKATFPNLSGAAGLSTGVTVWLSGVAMVVALVL